MSTPTFKTYAEMTDEEKARVDASEDAREHKKESFIGADITEPPPPGSWVEMTRAMTKMVEWDAWKDTMKESGEY